MTGPRTYNLIPRGRRFYALKEEGAKRAACVYPSWPAAATDMMWRLMNRAPVVIFVHDRMGGVERRLESR